jgi:hypothetical protein
MAYRYLIRWAFLSLINTDNYKIISRLPKSRGAYLLIKGTAYADSRCALKILPSKQCRSQCIRNMPRRRDKSAVTHLSNYEAVPAQTVTARFSIYTS